MKKITLLLSLITFIFFTSLTKVTTPKFDVEILQGGNSIEIVGDSVVLEKKQFQIQIALKKHDGVFIHSSLESEYFDLKETEEIKDYKYLGSKCRVEDNFNEDRDLYLDHESFGFYFYDNSMDWHRFDKNIIKEKKKIIGTLTTQYFSIKDDETGKIINHNVTNFDQTVYLFFMARNDKNLKEYGRAKVKIVWKD